MREILFRGKNNPDYYPGTSEWFEGSYIHQTQFYGSPVDRHWILFNGEFDMDFYDATVVYPDTVSQFTGIQDKDNKKLFEGDIIRFHAGYLQGHWTGVVEYADGSFVAKGIKPYRMRSDQDDAFVVPLSDIDKSTIEIIGNKWDNIDILEDSNK